MDLLLRGRGANISARAPLWFVRVCGASIAFATFLIADLLGLTDVTGFSYWMLSSASLLIGAVLAPTAYGAIFWLALTVLTATTLLVAFTPVVSAPARHFIRNDRGTEPADAVVVLSGSMTDEGLLMREVLARFISGIAEARSRHIPTLALSVIANGSAPTSVTSENDQTALAALLAPDLSVRFVRNVNSTRDEALQFAALARTHGWKRVVVVTSPLHTRRACRTFEVAGLPVYCAASQSREYSLTHLGGANSRLNVFRDLMYETTATLYYALRGWS